MSVKLCPKTATDQPGTFTSITRKTSPAYFDRIRNNVPLSASYLFGRHPMLHATMVNNKKLIIHLHKFDNTLVDLGDCFGRTALFFAIYKEDVCTTAMFLRLGADPNLSFIHPFKLLNQKTVKTGTTCLWIAAEIIQNVALTRLLIKHGALAHPALSAVGQKIFNTANNALIAKQKTIVEAIGDATGFVFPTDLEILIASYV